MTTDDVVRFCTGLRSLVTGAAETDSGTDVVDSPDAAAGLIDQIRSLEELKSAAAAAQVRATARFVRSQRAEQRAAGTPARDVGKGVAVQVALARRDSAAKGARHLGVAEALSHEMPHTFDALEAGVLSEWRATLVVRETACLACEHRTMVDSELAARPGGLEAMGDRTIAAEARRISYRLDPLAVTARARKAASERRVTLRPAPDTMSLLTGLLPAKQGVAAFAALTKHADSQRAKGDERSRRQIMADTLVERVTGQASAPEVPVEVHLTMTDRTLLGDGYEPAELEGYGPMPAPLTRDALRGAAADRATTAITAATAHTLVEQARVWVRRLYTAPDTGELVTMDSRRRCFEGLLRRVVIIRDRRCRTPWCDAPIRHVDHLRPVAGGGETTARNSQGLCEACNYAKQAPGWRARQHDDGTVVSTTPTGHRYVSRPPPGIGRPPPSVLGPGRQSRMECYFRDLALAV